jgi:FkbM family methyltransferase
VEGVGKIAGRANLLLRKNEGVRRTAVRLTKPIRTAPMPVLVGRAKGLRVRTGSSTLLRLISSIESEVEKTLLEIVHPGNTVFDIGANVGWYSLLAAREIGPSGAVTAFEPLLANATMIERNAEANRLKNIAVVPAAVGDRDGWASFSSESSLTGKVIKSGGSEVVPILSLDAWLSETGERAPDVIKMDIEGGEVEALRGMGGVLQEAKPTLIIELHATNADIADLLDEAGYTHHPIDHDAPTRDAPWWVHVLARPS